MATSNPPSTTPFRQLQLKESILDTSLETGKGCRIPVLDLTIISKIGKEGISWIGLYDDSEEEGEILLGDGSNQNSLSHGILAR